MIDLRDELTQHLRGDDLDQLDRRVARWLVGEVRRRVKLGPIRADLASLAGRVADTFADTPEGAARSRTHCPTSGGRPASAPPAGHPTGATRRLPPVPGRPILHALGRPRPRGDSMSLRLRCPSCQAAFVTSDDQAGQAVACPKCGAEQVAPSPEPAAESNVFVPKEPTKPRKSRRLLWALLALIPFLLVVGVVTWPSVRQWLNPRIQTPVEVAADDYLSALARGDAEAAARVGVVQEPPAIRSFRDLQARPDREPPDQGLVRPDRRAPRSRSRRNTTTTRPTGRFTPKDPLGPAAETLDALHDAKAKAEKDGIYKKMASGDPEEILHAAERLRRGLRQLSEGILAPKKLIPSYKMLVQRRQAPAPRRREVPWPWTTPATASPGTPCSKRPFPTLKADGPFVFEQAEVTAQVEDRLASQRRPAHAAPAQAVRFRLDAIDTGWKVVSARRIHPRRPRPARGRGRTRPGNLRPSPPGRPPATAAVPGPESRSRPADIPN